MAYTRNYCKSTRKRQEIIEILSKDVNRQFTEGETQMTSNGEVLKTTNIQRNANDTTVASTSHPLHWPKSEIWLVVSLGESVRKREPSDPAVRGRVAGVANLGNFRQC